MLSFCTVEPDTLELLKELTQEPFLKDCRLVGGTALALQYGHRKSVDLDFFGSFSLTGDQLFNKLEKYGAVTRHQNITHVKVFSINGVKVDIVDYSMYQWIDEAVVEDGLRLASPKDISALKINAIEGGGSKKDFIDVYFLLKHYSLQDILGFYSKKYPNFSIYRALMSLTYFADADKQELPAMIKPFDWEKAKTFISKKVKEYEKTI